MLVLLYKATINYVEEAVSTVSDLQTGSKKSQ